MSSMPPVIFWDLNVALFDLLTADLKAPTKVYSVPPDKPTYPFVAIGSYESDRTSYKGAHEQDIIATIHCWAKGESLKVLTDVMKEVVDSLMRKDVEVAGVATILQEIESMSVQPQFIKTVDGPLQHGRIRFKIKVGT